MRKRSFRLVAALLVWGCGALAGPVRRLVILKADGVPGGLIERMVAEGGKSPAALPWIRHVFFEHGTVVSNFYVRGIGVSAPSWAMLDTGRHMLIRGNAEYDRYTGRVYDYLNFFPFYLNNARSRRADMPGTEVLDGAGIPLLLDDFAPDERYQSAQLYQRGVHWKMLERTLRRLLFRSPRQVLNEWYIGVELTRQFDAQVEQELLAALHNERILYLDCMFGEFDHTAHLSNDVETQLEALRRLDALVGRIANAIDSGPLSRSTVFVLVSDHGINSSASVYSQGYDLIRFLGSAEGGGHHVLINRFPKEQYTLKGLYPFVSNVVIPSGASSYLAGQADEYPTAFLDLDGNERCSAYFRNSELNAIQILLQQLNRPESTPEMRAAAKAGLLELVERHRGAWERAASGLAEELGALRRAIERQRAIVEQRPKKWTAADRRAGRVEQATRNRAILEEWGRCEREYVAYLATLNRLLRIGQEPLEPGTIRALDYLGRRATGDLNRVYDLQNYVAGPNRTGLAVGPDGMLDWDNSFTRINYFSRLTGIRVRNNVQAGVSASPVDFLAMRIPAASLLPALRADEKTDEDAVWLYRSESSQALLLFRGSMVRYVPVRNLVQGREGDICFERQNWTAGLPLDLWEDPGLAVSGDRTAWLSDWHGEGEWFKAIHRTRYSNGLLGLKEFFRPIELGPALYTAGAGEAEARILRRFELRRRKLARADMLILASDHWNFNVRGYNPGGNHGSFFRASTHSVLMFSGAGIPSGKTVENPYDSLNFIPTVRSLLGAPAAELAAYPAPPIAELAPPPSPAGGR